MKHSAQTMEKLYQELGRLFYAVSACDKKIRKEEVEALKKVIREKWVNLDDTFDDFNTDTAYQIEIVFDWLVENHWNSENALVGFEKFKLAHEQLFVKKELKDLIMLTANKIADAFAAKNKSELIFISKLHDILYN